MELFSAKYENFTTNCMYSFDHNFPPTVVTSMYEPIPVSQYSGEYGKMAYRPKWWPENSQGAWELVKTFIFWIFTTSKPPNMCKFLKFYFTVDCFIIYNISAIHNGLISPLQVITCKNIPTYIGWRNGEIPHFRHGTFFGKIIFTLSPTPTQISNGKYFLTFVTSFL